MKHGSPFLILVMIFVLTGPGCRSIIGTQGASIGSSGGEIIGSVIGKASGNADIGAAIGETMGGVTGTVISNSMDSQVQDIKKEVSQAKVEKVGEGITVEFNSKILFNYNRSDLLPGAEKNLDELARVFQKYPATKLEIRGHTGNKGADSYNLSLSEKRAGSVAAYLNQKGIDNSRITTKGIGGASPKYSNDTATGRNDNQRVEFLITEDNINK